MGLPPQMDMSLDAADRLQAMLTAHSSAAKQLFPAAKLAGQQLEWMTPAVMGMGPQNLYAGPAVTLPIGGTIFLIADRKRVVTMQIIFDSDSIRACLDGMVKHAQELVDNKPTNWTGLIHALMIELLDRAGGKPTKDTPDPGPAGYNLLVGIVAGLPEATRHSLAGFLEESIAQNLCPSVVGLLGPASSGKPNMYSMVFPLWLPLAPYLDAVWPPNDRPNVMVHV